MRNRRLASRYARALLATLPDGAVAERVEAFLLEVGRLVAGEPRLRDLLLNPAVPRSARKEILEKLATVGEQPPQVRSFLAIVVAHGRAGLLPEIAQAFREERERRAGIVPVRLDVACELDRDLEARLHRALERLTGRKVRLQVAVRRELVGGAVTWIGSRVYDGSLRTQLARLRERMLME